MNERLQTSLATLRRATPGRGAAPGPAQASLARAMRDTAQRSLGQESPPRKRERSSLILAQSARWADIDAALVTGADIDMAEVTTGAGIDMAEVTSGPDIDMANAATCRGVTPSRNASTYPFLKKGTRLPPPFEKTGRAFA